MTIHTMFFERFSVFTTLGIRFWDPVTNRPITEGLDVRAHPQTAPLQQRIAFRTASGNYAFQGLPGLHDVEYPSGVGTDLLSPPAQIPFVVTVADDRRRFLPVAFAVDLPLPYRGLYQIVPPDSPPQDALPGFYLFSAPSRGVPPTFAAIRTQLIDAEAQTAAAHAVVEVSFEDGGTWYGMADERGETLVVFPYPAFRQILHPSPPALPPAPVTPQQWPVTIRIRYDPTTLQNLSGTDLPDFGSISAQPDGRIWASQIGPPAETLSADLTFAQELVLHTQGLSTLLVSAQSSLS